MTNYTILKWNAEGAAWSEHGDEDATSPTRAIRVRDVEPGIYVAIPTRSWKPLTVKSETVTKITIG